MTDMPKGSVADKLREARALIERGWTQHSYARGKSGRDVDLESKAAVCFCTTGATWRVSPDDAGETLDRVLQEIVGETFLVRWNDAPGRTQAEVLAAFDKAIELAEAQS